MIKNYIFKKTMTVIIVTLFIGAGIIITPNFNLVTVKAESQPDLIIEDLRYTPYSYQNKPKSTDDIEIEIDVLNQGGSMGFVGCDVLLKIDGTEYMVERVQSLGSMARDTVTSKDFSLPRGEYSIYAKVDSDNEHIESNENNNEFTSSIEVFNGEPENPLKPKGLTTTEVGKTIDYQFKTYDPDGDRVKYYIRWGDGNTEWTDYSPSGEWLTVSHTWYTFGEFNVKAYAKDEIYDDSSEYSPILTVFVSGTNSKPNVYDGEINDQGGSTDDRFKYFVKYEDADGDPPEEIYVYIDDSTNFYEMSLYSGDPANGRYCYPPTGNGITLPEGEHTYWFWASDGDKDDRDPDLEGDVHEGPYVGENTDPVLSNPEVHPKTGDPWTKFYYTIEYYDADGDPPITTDVYYDSHIRDMKLVSGIPADGTYRYPETDGITLSPGSHEYRFRFVDDRGGIANSPPSDTHPGPEVGPPKPNLVIKDISWDPPYPETGDYVDFRVEIQNIGGVNVEGTFDNEFYIGDSKYSWSHTDLDSFVIHFKEFHEQLTTGSVQLVANVDVNNDISESIEIDNSKTEYIGVSGIPDLIIDKIEWDTLENWDFFSGETVKFSATIKNVGDKKINNSGFETLLIIYKKIDDENWNIVDADEFWTPSLGIGESITFNHNTELNKGEHMIWVFVDDTDNIYESNEENNEKTEYFEVKTSKDTLFILDKIDVIDEALIGKIDKDINNCVELLVSVYKEIYTHDDAENNLLALLKFSSGLLSKKAFLKYASKYFISEYLETATEYMENQQALEYARTFGSVDVYNEIATDLNIIDYGIADVVNNEKNDNEVVILTQDKGSNPSYYIDNYRYNSDYGFFEKIIPTTLMPIKQDSDYPYHLYLLDLDTKNDNGDEILIQHEALEVYKYNDNLENYELLCYWDPEFDIRDRSIKVEEVDNDPSNGKEILLLESSVSSSLGIYRFDRYTKSFIKFKTIYTLNKIINYCVGEIDNNLNNGNEVILFTEDGVETYSYNPIAEGFYLVIPKLEESPTELGLMVVCDIDNTKGNELLLITKGFLSNQYLVTYRYNPSLLSFEKVIDDWEFNLDISCLISADIDNKLENGIELLIQQNNKLLFNSELVILRYDSSQKNYKEDPKEMIDREPIAYSNIFVIDATNNLKNNVVFPKSGIYESCIGFFHYEQNQVELENYLREEFRRALNDIKIFDIEGTPTIGQIKQFIQNKCDDFIEEFMNEYPDGLPEDYPLDDVSEHIIDMGDRLIHSVEEETTIWIWDSEKKTSSPIQIGSIGPLKSATDTIIQEALENNKNDLEIIGYYQDAWTVWGTEVVVLKLLTSATVASPILLDTVMLLGWAIWEIDEAIYKKENILIKDALVFNAAVTPSVLAGEIFITENALENLFECVRTDADPLGEIIDVNMPDIVIDDGNDVEETIGSVTIQNKLSNPVNVTLLIKIFGPSNIGKPLIKVIIIDEIETLVTTAEISFDYSIFGIETWKTCEYYSAEVYASFGGNITMYPHPITFSVGSQKTVNSVNIQNVNEIMSGKIKEGQYYNLPYKPGLDAKKVEFSLNYEGSDLDLHLYDSTGNHIGLNYLTDNVESEIPDSTYSGSDKNPEFISFQPIPGEQYIVEVYAREADEDETFFVTATEIPDYPPMMAIIPSKIELEIHPEEIKKDSFFIHEYGGQKSLEQITVSSSDLVNEYGDIIPASAISIEIPENTLSASSSMNVDLTVKCPFLVKGKYTGTITATANNGNIFDTTLIEISIVDNLPPEIYIFVPYEHQAVQDGITFEALVIDSIGVDWVTVSIREPGGEYGTIIDPIYESIPATYMGDYIWQLPFDTALLQDGYYLMLVEASDTLNNEGYDTAEFSIRNWAVVDLLPSTKNHKAGRTMPVKFSLRIAEAVDPEQPFVRNEELFILIYEEGFPETILQKSAYGDKSIDYRIDRICEHYITNFKTSKKPKTYVVEIWRKDMLLDGFEFETVKKN